MANELDKTIEELEAEVLNELEEANGADAPMKSAGKADPMDSINSDGATGKADVGGAKPEGKAQKDVTKAVNDPADAIGKKASADRKSVV